jgi:hypothetical protein
LAHTLVLFFFLPRLAFVISGAINHFALVGTKFLSNVLTAMPSGLSNLQEAHPGHMKFGASVVSNGNAPPRSHLPCIRKGALAGQSSCLMVARKIFKERGVRPEIRMTPTSKTFYRYKKGCRSFRTLLMSAYVSEYKNGMYNKCDL